MIDLYYWPTANGHKITMFLEESGLEYRVRPVNIGAGDQLKPDFLAISPNNKIPAVIDHAPSDNGQPISVFESGAILIYLAEKVGRFTLEDLRGKVHILEWVFWQVGGLGPMSGQNYHFRHFAPSPLPYAIERYGNETRRLYGVLNRRLEGRRFITGDQYTIADMASYPWIVSHEKQGVKLDEFLNLKRWFEEIGARAATKRAYAMAEAVNPGAVAGLTPEQKRVLFGARM